MPFVSIIYKVIKKQVKLQTISPPGFPSRAVCSVFHPSSLTWHQALLASQWFKDWFLLFLFLLCVRLFGPFRASRRLQYCYQFVSPT